MCESHCGHPLFCIDPKGNSINPSIVVWIGTGIDCFFERPVTLSGCFNRDSFPAVSTDSQKSMNLDVGVFISPADGGGRFVHMGSTG